MSSTRSSVARPSRDEPHIGKYKLIKTIGKGNFAKVKLAKHIPTGHEVSSTPCNLGMLENSFVLDSRLMLVVYFCNTSVCNYLFYRSLSKSLTSLNSVHQVYKR